MRESYPQLQEQESHLIRRGASKLYLFPHHKEAYNCFKRGAAFKSTVDHLAPLGLIERRPGGWFPAKDADAISCVKLLDEKDYIALLSSSATTDGFRLQAAKVRDSALLPAYAAVVQCKLVQTNHPCQYEEDAARAPRRSDLRSGYSIWLQSAHSCLDNGYPGGHYSRAGEKVSGVWL